MEDNNVGYLRVRVYGADEAFPIEGAIVLISAADGENGENGIVRSLRTDSSGVTETVALPAKPRGLSEEPGNIDPFAVYNVEIKKDGYYTVNDINVPIFEGIASTLPVRLVPLGFGQTNYGTGYNENRIYNDISTGENLQ